MDRPWLSSYPSGVPAEIDTQELASLVTLMLRACERYGERPAFTHLGTSLSFRAFERLTRDFAAHLCAELGSACKGERIALMLPNCLQYPVAILGALRAGLVVVNVNPMYTASELEFQLRDSNAVALVVLENLSRTVQSALPHTAVRHVITTQLGDLLAAPRRWLVNLVMRHRHPFERVPGAHSTSMRQALLSGAHASFDEVPLVHSDAAFVQYTGGTSGRPKGALLSHGNMVANVLQTAAWVGPRLEPGAETVITALPLSHVFALTANLLVFLHMGGCEVLVSDARDVASLAKLIRRTRFTAITGVNTLFDALMNAPGAERTWKARRGMLKLAVAGGMAVTAPVARRWLQATGIPLLEGYGLTEASPIVCVNPVDAREYSGKLGLPLPSTEVRICDNEGEPVPLGVIGEILVRGPQVMQGYWRQPEETAVALSADGWLRTGDLGRMDERGFVEFVDRKKDVIVVSGFKAYPAEIEEVVRRHPAVKDAGAVGIRDARCGEAVVLFVVARDPGLNEAEIRSYCEQHLTGYKRPRFIQLCDELPRTALGKVSHRRLRDDAARLFALASEEGMVSSA